MNLKTIYETYKEDIDSNSHKSNKKKKREKQIRNQMESIISDAEMSMVQSHYPMDYASSPTSLRTDDEDENVATRDQALQPVKLKPIESNLNKIALDENRIVHPNASLSGLYEFVPATKIKGNQYCKKISDTETLL